MKFWLNGAFQEDRKAIKINDRGFLLGDGLFETFYVENGQAFEYDAHLNRLFASLKILDIQCPYTIEDLKQSIDACLMENGISLGSLRLTVTRGTGPRGLLPPENCDVTVLITCVGGQMKRHDFPPVSLMVSSIRRNDTSPTSQLKTIGGYLDNILALQEAKSRGFDDAILLNTKDHIACTTSANIFLKLDGIWHTPAQEDGILSGIYRDEFIQEQANAAQPVIEQSLTLDDLKRAEQIMLTNSLIGKRLVHEVEID